MWTIQVLIAILLAIGLDTAPIKEKTTKTHILCPNPACPTITQHYRNLGWV